MNWKKITILTLMTLVLFSLISVASANEDIINANATYVENTNTLNLAEESDVLTASDTFAQLDRTIQNSASGATVVLDRDYVYTEGDSKNGIAITKDITIDGKGHTLDGAGQASIFKISGNRQVTLKDITFINAYGTNGAAVSWTSDDSVNILKSNFINNTATGDGGAIYISSSSSTITFNSAIADSVFTNNKASNGGAIYAKGTVLDITKSNFSNDIASINGGSILLDTGASINNCLIVNSSSGRSGGGLYVNSRIIDFSFLPPEYRDKLGIFNSRMILCKAGQDGGAGYVYANGGTVSNVTVINCTADRGGAGYIDGDHGSLVNSTLINNTAGHDGGAVYWAGINGTVYGTTFINNVAKLGDGGALYSFPVNASDVFSGESFVNRSTFINNTARKEGGAIYCSGIFTIVFNSHFTGDRAYNGAGIYLDVGAAIQNCTFIDESATYDGGAIYLSASNPDVHDYIAQHPLLEYLGVGESVFDRCNAGHDGGAAYVSGNYGMVRNVVLTNNTAGRDGGAAYVAGNSGSLFNSTLISNHAGRDGGAITWAGNNGTVDNITCILNTVGGGSGSICIYGSNSSVKNSLFTLSSSTLSGGAIYVYGNNVNITNSVFDKCDSGTKDGGAIAIAGYHTHIEDCNFTMNRVNIGTGHGGSIFIQGERTHIFRCNFDHCTAFEGGFIYVNGTNAWVNDSFGDFSFAVEGGAFYVNGDYATISNSNMSYNNATTYAGAIYVAGDFATIDNVEFLRCISYNNGAGAIYIEGLNATVQNSRFTENKVSGLEARGGSINIQGDYTKILNCIFDRCTANEGGVVYVKGSHALIDGYSCIRSFAHNSGGAMYVAGNNVTISNFNISLTNATNYGGAIYIAGDDAKVFNSNFTRCIADNFHGGALYIAGFNANVHNSTFVQNRVNTQTGRGGSIEVQGNSTKIYNCTFDMCTAYEGGIIYINGSDTVIDGFTSTHCVAYNDGGAIYVAGDNAVFYDFDIALTNATNNGGAIYVEGDNASLYNGILETCIVYDGNGGAMYVAGFNTTIYGCDFERSQSVAGNGGSIYVAGLYTNIHNSIFSQNKVNSQTGRGGSIEVQGNFTTIYNSTFDRCNAYEGGIIYINGSDTVIDGFNSTHCIAYNNGGAIYVAGDNAVFYDFDIAMTNATNNGGAIYVAGDNATIHDGILDMCIVSEGNGGAIYVAGFNTTVNKCDFEMTQTLTGNGGAVYVAGLNATISNSIFVHNKVNSQTGRGGSIEVQGNYTTISNSTFDMCNAYEGGVIYINGSHTLIDGFNSIHCFALNDGGAIYVAGDNAVFADFTITMTNATNNGGAIYVAGDNATIYNGILDSSIVGEGNGGAIYVAGYNTTVDNCTFDKSQAAKGNGGTIYIEGDMASVENSNFIRSFANDGGIIYIVGHDVLVDNSNFTYSWATENGGSIYVEGHDAVISNSNFRFTNASSKNNEYAGFGGAIYVYGDNVNITSSTFFKTIAEKGGSGGAIFIFGENVTISKSNFTDTTAPDYYEQEGGASAAGAISIGGSRATIEESNFNRCHARNGGVMFIAGTDTRIINSNITDCYADGDGGAMYIFGEYTNITGTLFDDCHGSRDGGAIYIRFGEFTNIENSTFIKCYADLGGAINVDGNDVKVSTSNMIDCYAVTDGGAIYISGNNVTMDGTNFTDCYAVNNNGGAIYWIGTVGLVNNSNFVNNTAPKLGGAIFMKENAKITFQNSRFTNNSAGINGGAIDFNRGAHDEIIINSTFENNYANRSAGAVFWFGTNGTIKDSTFINNRAYGIVNYTDSYGNVTYGGYGGAVMWTGAQGVVDNCTFINNYAQYNEETKSGGRGGAVYLQGSDVGNGHDTAFYNSVFINNTAGYNGGAVDWFRGAANGRVENATFINNTAHRSGGGIYWSGVNGTIKNATFINNTALGEITDANGGGDGGAVLWVGPEGLIETVNFTNNRAAYSGGAIFLKGSDNGTAGNCSNVFIEDGIFENNVAGLNGGAVTFQRGAMNGTLSNSVFTNNTASRNGGAVFWYGRNGTISNSTFIENEALGLVDTDARGVHQYIDENGNPVLGGSGGAIAWIGEVGKVDDSDFINNTARRHGGAIFLRDNAYTTISNDNFINNTAGVNGGAVDFNRGAHNGAILNSTFENNLANRSAGAVFWFGTDGTIKGSEFKNNTALGIVEDKDSYGNLTYGGYGGAVMWTGAHGIVEDCTFEDNTAARRGGAVYLQGSDVGNCTNTTFDSCVFTSNVAGTNGGAIDWHEGAHDGNIYNSTFENNFANSNGGAVYWRGHDGKIIGSNFTNNTAFGDHPGSYGNVGDGGAMFWAGINGLVEDCRFIDNEAVNNPNYNASGRGGAVYIEPCDHGNKNTTFRNVYFENNIAGTNGGAINWHEGAHDGMVDNATFINNTAKRSGGAIFWNGHNGTIRYSKFYDNDALGITNATSVRGEITSGGDGGAVMWSGARGVVEHCNFVNNTAAKRGGAVLLQGNEAEPCINTSFKDSYFANNAAGFNGGAIDWYRGAKNGLVDNITFVNNSAKRSGGAIYWSGVNGTIKNSRFIDNSALGNITDANGGGDGGAVLWVGQNGKIENSKFTGNDAAFSGGAIFLKGSEEGAGNCSNVTIDKSVFENNVAGLNGGAITFQRGAMNGTLLNSKFTNNSASRNGGAVLWYGRNGTVVGCDFKDNKAIGLVDEDSRGVHTYIDGDGNKVPGGSGGAIAWTGDTGLVSDCSFENNDAFRNGGAVFLRDNVRTSFDDSRFINNSAKQGGAIYWSSDSNENLTDCILTGNVANQGSAIYLAKNNLEIINSVLLDNKADSVELALNVTNDGNEVVIIAEFKGNDNLINAIWNNGTIGLTNVTYLGADGITNTGSARKVPIILEGNVKPKDNNIYQTQYEAGQNVTFELYDNQGNLLTKQSARTNASGVAKLTLNANADKVYEFVYHPDDNYYTGIENSTSKNIAVIEIPTTDIYYLENETFIISVRDRNNASEIPTGEVTVWLNGISLDNFTLNNGKTVEINLADLKCGTYDVTVRYAGDDAFLPRINSTTFKVMKIPSFIIPTVEDYTYGESGKIIIQVPQNENNTVEIRLNGKTYEVKINESGYCEFDIPELYFGVYDVELTYPESENYLKSANATSFEIYPLINVNVVKSANVTDAYVLDLINFTITVSNDGQISAHNVTVSDKFSDDFVIMTYSEGGKVLAGNVISWNIDEMESGSKMDLWVIVSPIMNCTFTNVATVKSDEAGVNESNKADVSVKPVVDLKIIKKVNATEVYVDDKITYTIEVTNLGLCNATNVKVSEKLSKSLKLISADTKNGYYDEHDGIWYIGNLNTLEDASLTLTVRAVSSGTIENIVSVTSDEKELYGPDNNYTCENVSVSKWDVPVRIDAKNLTYGDAAIIDIHTPKDSNGTFNITICGETYTDVPCDEGAWEYVKVHIAAGNYSINVTYSGDNKYNPSSAYASFYVTKLTPEINIEVVDIIEGEIEVLNVTVNAPGTVNITVGGITVEIPLDENVVTTDVLQASFAPNYDGKATWRIINLAKGTYDVLAVYNGNENYTSVNATGMFHVRAEVDDVEVYVDDVAVGDAAIIEVTYPSDATGAVTVKVNGKTYTKELEDGTAIFRIPNLKAGHYDVDVSYEGDDEYLPNEAKGSFDVLKLDPGISAVKPKVKEGETAKIIINLPKDAKGTVSLEIGGKYYYAPVQNGKAVFDIPNLKFGDYDIAIHYSGDDKYDDEYLYITLSVDLPDDGNHKNEHDYDISGYSAHEGLAKYPTANPIFALLFAVLAIGFGQMRRFKKE